MWAADAADAPARSGGLRRHLVEALGQGVPAEGGALDADRELHDALERGQLAELVEVDLLGLARPPSPSLPEGASWIDIIPLKVRMSWRTSSSDLPLTAADISEAEDWLMEQPEPRDLEVGQRAVLDHDGDHDLVAAQRVEALDPVGGGRVQLAPVPGRAVVVEDDLAVQVFEARPRSVTRTIYRLPAIPRSAPRCRVRR